jgi:chromosome segregation ATPase
MAQTSTPAQASTIEDQRNALRTEQAEAQQKAEAPAARLALLEGLASGEAAWSAAKDHLNDLDALWGQVKDCRGTLEKALGDASAPVKKARDDYGDLVKNREQDLADKQKGAADAQAELEDSRRALQAAEDAFYGPVRQHHHDDVRPAHGAGRSHYAAEGAMGGTPCNAETAYLVALDIEDEYQALVEAAMVDLAQAAAKALAEPRL